MSGHRSFEQAIVQAVRIAGFVGGKTIPKNIHATLAEHQHHAKAVTRRVPPRPAMGKQMLGRRP